jgi:peptidoglycan/LPS O-acetylase OafA/YrhL
LLAKNQIRRQGAGCDMKSHVPNQARIPELDGIRGLAISLVVFQHYVTDSIIPGTNRFGDFIKHNFTLGGTGVDLFFVLSGFLIGGILIDNRRAENYFKSFYIRRICRIFPLYYFCLLTYAMACLLLSRYATEAWFNDLFVSGVSLWTYATFTQSIFEVLQHGTGLIMAGWLTPTWSLAIEEQFYLVLPAVIMLVRPSWILPVCLGWICTHSVLYLYMWMYHPVSYFFTSLIVPFRAEALLIGVVCACLLRGERSTNWLLKNQNILYVLLGVFLLGTGYIAPKFNLASYEIDRDIFFYLWMALLYACVLLLAITAKGGVISRFTCFTPFRKLGLIAYGVFLFHQPVNGLLHGLILGRDRSVESFSDGAMTLAALVVTLVFASISWQFFEKPIIAWGHSFLYSGKEITAK